MKTTTQVAHEEGVSGITVATHIRSGRRAAVRIGRTYFIPEEGEVLQDWINLDQVAQRLGLSRARVYQLIYSGRLPAQKVGREWLARRADVEAFALLPRLHGGAGHRLRRETSGTRQEARS